MHFIYTQKVYQNIFGEENCKGMPFFLTVKTVLNVDKNEDKTMPAWFQVQEFLYVQSIVWILVSSFIAFSLKIGFGGLDTLS